MSYIGRCRIYGGAIGTLTLGGIGYKAYSILPIIFFEKTVVFFIGTRILTGRYILQDPAPMLLNFYVQCFGIPIIQ